jgi:CRP-like cAMP-binding protein
VTDAHQRLARYFAGWGPLPPTARTALAEVFHPARAARHELLVRAGDRPDQVHFVLRGLVRVYYLDPDGVERTKAFRAEDHLVCAFSAALRGEPSGVFVQAVEPTELLVASRAGFDALVSGDPAWRDVLARITEALYLEEERLRRQLLTQDATTRYREFLADQPDLAARLSQRQVAAFLGITPEALSRIRGRLARA